MEWILYIIGGIFLIGFLWGIGLIPEFLTLIGFNLFVGLVSGVIAWIFDWGFEAGFHVGIYIGVVLYALYCIGRIINPDITIEVYTDGSHKVLSERWNGVIGLVVLVGAILFAVFG